MSLKKIAELAGTSISTVSRVLNQPEHNCNEPGLAEKIWDITAKLNYLPNTSARNLRLGVSDQPKIFTVDIFLTRFDSMDKDYFFRELFQHIKEELIPQGCFLGEILSAIDIMSFETSYISRKSDTGLIILGKCPRELVPVLKKRYAYIAGIDRNPTDYEYDEVICNGKNAAEKAVEYLISLGHKNIAYIGDCTYESRYIGYYQALLNHRIPLNHMNIHPTDQTIEQGFDCMISILQSSERPTAIFCANDCTAIGVLKAVSQNKKRGYVPSIISIDNINHSQNTVPMLTTIDIPKKEMGHHAVMLLLDRKNGNHTENVRIELPCRLIERESCTYNIN